ncbi:hydantoinase B/oxoprolinase family protein [Acuticoccus mangrovi]|uniref:Hydantoinase B/oxoprolinase family protein n=1 Tax=Acuticoccus mangrovi TaxID=2796142 RepID=A0A934ISL9_9HYPH|nr:hydantoinase B/oxoprolinase family protein [Acuticoccus mangrovi]MBJ3776919.1 hydantoinase B/oxoprolinase family protein [Acuticoccus mangrovi]
MQVMWDRLISVVEEQAQTLIRTSFSPTVREAGDLSAGVFDLEGRMLAQAVTGTPGHVNSMAVAIAPFLAEFPLETMRPGDAYITNDPWLVSGHLHDITVVTPAFLGDRPVAFLASTIHVVDIGGRGMGPDGAQVYEEGFYIPVMYLARGGEMNDDLLRLLRANTREPAQVEGDVFSACAAGEEGARRLVAMMEEFAITSIAGLASHIIDSSRSAMAAQIASMKRGRYRHEVTGDGYDAPVTIAATLDVGEDGITADFAGTSGASKFGINVVYNYTAAYVTFAIKCAVAPDLPNNYGSMLPIRTVAPEGSILNAQKPSPVAARHVIGHMVPDALFGCLHQVVAEGMPAESSMMWNPMLRGLRHVDGRALPWEYYSFHSGGMGGTPGADGLSATVFPGGVKVVPIEVAETVAPIRYRRKEFRPDSGGAGRYRGGLGQVIEIESATGDPFEIQAMFDRIAHPALGREGGGDGAPGALRTSEGRRLRGKGLQGIEGSDVLVMELPGGGGFGAPADRDPAALAEDLAEGRVSREAAERDYPEALARLEREGRKA